jgi:hypothetical protein
VALPLGAGAEHIDKLKNKFFHKNTIVFLALNELLCENPDEPIWNVWVFLMA